MACLQARDYFVPALGRLWDGPSGRRCRVRWSHGSRGGRCASSLARCYLERLLAVFDGVLGAGGTLATFFACLPHSEGERSYAAAQKNAPPTVRGQPTATVASCVLTGHRRTLARCLGARATCSSCTAEASRMWSAVCSPTRTARHHPGAKMPLGGGSGSRRAPMTAQSHACGRTQRRGDSVP
jgi:hypothetical protein